MPRINQPTTDHDQLSGVIAGQHQPVVHSDTDHSSLLIAMKPADETVNNSAVFQNDDDLLAAVEVNSTYHYLLLLTYHSTAVADFKIQFTAPAASIIRRVGIGISSLLVPGVVVDESTFMGPGGNGAGVQFPAWEEGILKTGGNAGNFQLQWAQNVAEVSNTVVETGSFLILRKVA